MLLVIYNCVNLHEICLKEQKNVTRIDFIHLVISYLLTIKKLRR